MLRVACQQLDGEKMKIAQYTATLNTKVDVKTRQAVEREAAQKGISIVHVIRDLLYDGMRAQGIGCEE
jgi:hypothetical protein